MKKVLASLLAMLVILGGIYVPVVRAEEIPETTAARLAEAGITPDSIFYGFDRLMEELQDFLAFGEEAKAELLEKLAEERLAEAGEMLAAEKQELAQKMVDEFALTLKSMIENVTAVVVETGSLSESERLTQAVNSLLALREGFELKFEQMLEQFDEQAEDALKAAEEAAEALKELEKAESDDEDELEDGEAEERKVKEDKGEKVQGRRKLELVIIEAYGLEDNVFGTLKDAGLNFGQSKMVAILMGESGKDASEIIELREELRGWDKVIKELGFEPSELVAKVRELLEADGIQVVGADNDKDKADDDKDRDEDKGRDKGRGNKDDDDEDDDDDEKGR